MGDLGSLAYVMERIESGRTVYNSDENYVREKFRQLRQDITRESEDPPSTPQDVVESPYPQYTPRVVHGSDAGRGLLSGVPSCQPGKNKIKGS